ARRGALVTWWFILLASLVLAANSTWHPASMFASPDSWLMAEVLGFRPVALLLMAFLVLVLVLALRAAWRIRAMIPRLAPGLVGAGLVALLGGILLAFADAGSSHGRAPGGPPDVIIIGVDSLRDDLTQSRSGAVVTPNIDRFLDQSYRFSDAISPLARTYGSWVSILTGRDPVSTNARVNLMPRTMVHEGVTLPGALKQNGYRTIYAIDEVRFANFDESFGFDQLITPPVGAADFLLGYAGDIPLVNLIATTAAGGLLFPSNHANRAANVTYEPEDFVARLENELDVDGPAFVAIHLTLAHWPYSWATTVRPTTPQQYRPAYRHAIEEVDRQFESVLQLLTRKGLLDNSLVVVLSDHGEALGGGADSMLRKTGSSREIWDSLWGHGTSVMSPHQYGVVLAMRAFGRARLPGAAGSYDWPVTLEDLRPTLEEFATGRAPSGVDGVSLLPLLADPAKAASIDSRVRFTETDFNTPSTLAGRYEASGIIDEAAVFYELNPETGWVQFRSSRLPLLMMRKQRAALSRDSLLAAIPGQPEGTVSWLFTDRHKPLPRRLQGRPDPATDPEAARLWDALHARFKGELPADSELPLM
ncbi:MAG: sulfatase-like hydrolase/transferase, partial [Gammaproteobacteria bacterium]|nr:sulfatase-like hydrolase/transferase [Gammaproteobacteria bacterium]